MKLSKTKKREINGKKENKQEGNYRIKGNINT